VFRSPLVCHILDVYNQNTFTDGIRLDSPKSTSTKEDYVFTYQEDLKKENKEEKEEWREKEKEEKDKNIYKNCPPNHIPLRDCGRPYPES